MISALLLLLPLLAEAANTKIVGGTPVTATSTYPFFVEWEDAKCGASLIHDDIVLSAAHCENDAHPFDKRIFMLGLNSEEGLFRTIESQIAHPLYNGLLQDFDFLLLKLGSSALVDENANPTGAATVTLNRNRNLPALNDALIGVGYGKTDQTADTTSEVLREVEIYYVSDETCLAQYGYSDFIADIMFCAGVPGGGKDTCQGDSGGPILHKQTGTQVGVVSFGIGCADADYAGVNARVEAATDWIDDMICEMSDYPPARCNGQSNNNNVLPPQGNGKLSVKVKYDSYPEETAWAFSYTGPGNSGNANNNKDPVVLHYETLQQTSITDGESRSTPFTNLPQGSYLVQFGDAAGDGICCSYGNGEFRVVDDNTGDTVWSNNGEFGAYIGVTLQVDAAGNMAVLAETFDYENSWEAFEAVNHPPTFDPEWPGVMPVAAVNTAMVNAKFDAFPAEIDWFFYEYDGSSNWNLLKQFDGTTQGVHNNLVSVEIGGLKAGWHRFSITDSQGDGLCCTYRRGWVSITAPIITTRLQGLVWGNNGDFGSGIDVYLQIDAEGFVSQVSYDDPTVTTTVRRRGDGRQLHRHDLAFSTYTDLPKERVKNVGSVR